MFTKKPYFLCHTLTNFLSRCQKPLSKLLTLLGLSSVSSLSNSWWLFFIKMSKLTASVYLDLYLLCVWMITQPNLIYLQYPVSFKEIVQSKSLSIILFDLFFFLFFHNLFTQIKWQRHPDVFWIVVVFQSFLWFSIF